MKPQDLLFNIQNSQHHTGLEINAYPPSFSKNKLNVCLVFPDTYDIGMSHQGIKLLYHFLNQHPRVNAERCFLPDPLAIPVFRDTQTPLFSLESKTCLADFDLIAISLLSELSFTNVLAVLDLAQIPLLYQDRVSAPLIAMGGISAINPEPLRLFADFFALGDGEVLFPQIIGTMLKYVPFQDNRQKILKTLDDHPGFYVPALHPPLKKETFYIPDMAGKIVKKQFTPSIDQPSVHNTNTIVPLGQVVFDRLDIEVARGCPHSCRFCQARNYYAPFRIKSGEHVLEQIDATLKKTGFDTISLASLSTGDHPDLPLILDQINTVLPPCTTFSFPSLRPKTLTDQMLKTLSQYRRTGLTIVPEAGSERLRRVIGKTVTDQEIFTAVDNAIANGWQKIKLYFMIGLPTETDEDLLAIVKLVEKILDSAYVRRCKIDLTLSISTFVPKPHTPFQWAPRIGISEAKRRIRLVKEPLRNNSRIKFDFHSLEKGLVETILSRGDMRVGSLILDAFRAGEVFTAWDSAFHPDVWLDLIDKSDLMFLTQELSTETELPWSFIEINNTHATLAREYLAAITQSTTAQCSNLDCSKCKGCLSTHDHPLTPSKDNPAGNNAPQIRSPSDAVKVRLFYKKVDDFRFFSHLSLQKYIERIVRISQLPFRYTEGFHPRIKMAMLPPMPVLAQSFCECIELYLDADMKAEEVLAAVNAVQAPLKFYKVTMLSDQSSSLMRDMQQMTYSFSGPTTLEQEQSLSAMLLENESCKRVENALFWTVSGQHDVAARFGKTYRLLDPEKQQTRHLTRISIQFTSDMGA
jgi:radical SAM family uncharacterized protein